MNKEKQIRVLLVRPGQYPEERMVNNTLPALQKLVGGDIETVSPWPDRVCIVCDDEGKLKGKPFNRTLGYYDVLAGDFFICGVQDGDFCSLTDTQISRYEKLYHDPQIFLSTSFGLYTDTCTPQEYARFMNPSTPDKTTMRNEER